MVHQQSPLGACRFSGSALGRWFCRGLSLYPQKIERKGNHTAFQLHTEAKNEPFVKIRSTMSYSWCANWIQLDRHRCSMRAKAQPKAHRFFLAANSRCQRSHCARIEWFASVRELAEYPLLEWQRVYGRSFLFHKGHLLSQFDSGWRLVWPLDSQVESMAMETLKAILRFSRRKSATRLLDHGSGRIATGLQKAVRQTGTERERERRQTHTYIYRYCKHICII